MSDRLQVLLDKQEITELVHTYCNAMDRRDYDLLRTLYHDDASDDHGTFFKGPAVEFIEQLPAIQAPMNILHHNITTLNIAVEDDYGEGEVYVLAVHQAAIEGRMVDLLIGGRYFDKYEKRKGVWRYSERTVVADWATCSDPSVVCLDHPMLEGSHFGRPGADDPSYPFFRLLQRGRR